jgi:hypothetical protein
MLRPSLCETSVFSVVKISGFGSTKTLNTESTEDHRGSQNKILNLLFRCFGLNNYFDVRGHVFVQLYRDGEFAQ